MFNFYYDYFYNILVNAFYFHNVFIHIQINKVKLNIIKYNYRIRR